VSAAKDPRWLPGARWEHRGAPMTLRRTSSFQGLAWAHFWAMDWPVEIGDMTEANGWRYVGPPEQGRDEPR
jgi:hypothetical protein